MNKINTQAALLMDDETFRRTMVRALNQIMDALAVGVVHENKVHAARRADDAEDALISVITANIEKELR